MLKGVIHNGQVVLTQPSDLPEGTEVEIVPVGVAQPDDEGPLTTSDIARTLAAMDAIQPFEMSDMERAAIIVDRESRKEWEKSRFNEHAERLRETWE
jgi:hypothetical protein